MLSSRAPLASGVSWSLESSSGDSRDLPQPSFEESDFPQPAIEFYHEQPKDKQMQGTDVLERKTGEAK